MDWTLRKPLPQDRDIFISLCREFYASTAVLHPIPEVCHRRTFEELLRAPTYLECRLFESEDEVFGYALLSHSFSPEVGGTIVWIEELYIRPAYQGRGCAGAFFRRLGETFPAARYRLEIEPDNTRARALYVQNGFRALPYAQMVRDREANSEEIDGRE